MKAQQKRRKQQQCQNAEDAQGRIIHRVREQITHDDGQRHAHHVNDERS